MMELAYKNFKEEVELFFMTKFIDGKQLKKTYCECLDIMFDITKKADTTKGIIAFNPDYGQGKSFFFEVIHHRHKRTKGKNLFLRTSAKELCQIYTSTTKGVNPEKALLKFISVKHLYIDDIGDELKEGAIRANYSNKLNVIRWVLLKRYEFWIEKGWKTSGSTNLTIEQIGENYDGRVADRLLQMTHFKEFKFLKSGSFRQIKSTRKLKPEEIQANRNRLKPKESKEKIDVERYFNELVKEGDFDDKGSNFWSFVKGYLERKGLLTNEDYMKIDEKDLDASELLLRQETRSNIRSRYKHAPGMVRMNHVDNALSEIKGSKIYDHAKLIIAKRKLIELKESNYIFS